MCKKKQQNEYTTLVSDGFGNEQEGGTYEVAFRRWLVRQIEEQRMTVSEAIERFNFFCPCWCSAKPFYPCRCSRQAVARCYQADRELPPDSKTFG